MKFKDINAYFNKMTSPFAAAMSTHSTTTWNGASTDFPVTVDDYGTALISGFSPSILKSVIETGEFTPYNVLRTTLDSNRYAPAREQLTKSN